MQSKNKQYVVGKQPFSALVDSCVFFDDADVRERMLQIAGWEKEEFKQHSELLLKEFLFKSMFAQNYCTFKQWVEWLEKQTPNDRPLAADQIQ